MLPLYFVSVSSSITARARAPRAPGPVGEREPLDAAKHGEDARDVDAAHPEVARGDAA